METPRAVSVPRLGHRSALDGLRGIAVLLVVLVHSGNSLWPQAAGWLAQGGPLGVHLFFVLSGFLITTLLLAEGAERGRVRLGRFAERRARRLVPAVVALLAVLAVVAALGDRLQLATVGSSAAYVLTATANEAMLGFTFPGLDGATSGGLVPEMLHMWSLAIEVQFYVLWAVAVWAMTRAGLSLRWMAGLTAAAIAVVAIARARAFAGGTPWLELYLTTWSRLDAPLVGALAGIAFAAGWAARPDRRLLAAAGTAGLAAFALTAFLTDWTLPALPRGLYTGLALCAAVAILAAVVAEGRLARCLSVRPLVWLGTISYSLYVWHYGLFFTIERHDPSWPGPVRFVLGVGAALILATASYHLIERPLVRRGRDHRAAPARGIAVPGAAAPVAKPGREPALAPTAAPVPGAAAD